MMRQRWMTVHKVVLAVVLPVLKRAPYLLSVRLLSLLGRLDQIVVPGQSRAYHDAVARAADRLGCRWDLRAVRLGLARRTYRWRARDVLLDRLDETRVAALFRVSGRDHLDDAIARERGVLLLANHFGAHVLISHWMFRQGYEPRWFGERPRSVSNYLEQRLRAVAPSGDESLYVSRATTMTEAAAMIVRVSRLLNAGAIVKVACDVRWRGGKVATADFLGRPETFASSWVHLAARTGAAVVPAFCRDHDDGSFDLEFHSPFHVPPDAAQRGQDAPWVRQALAEVEAQVRRHPEHSNDYFFWEPTDPRLTVLRRPKVRNVVSRTVGWVESSRPTKS